MPETSPVAHWDQLTWPEIDALDRQSTVLLLPLGAVEAHGPHLPLATDRIISVAMCEAAARELDAARPGDPERAEHRLRAVLLPPVVYTAAPFARGFAGTLSLRPTTVQAVLVDLVRALAEHGFRHCAWANAHLDPAHLGSIHAAIEELRAASDPVPVFPDITRRRWARRLGDEFASGACHAGCYEGSMVLASEPELVRRAVQARLEANPHSLSTAIRQGLRTFEEAGGPDAYFGDPAAATAEEGRHTITTLGSILVEAIRERLG